MTVYTIGYEGLNPDIFISLLSKHDIETVVDVREMPLSRKPGFSKKSLENLLNLSGYEYAHFVKLGCPKSVRNNYRSDQDWQKYTADFLRYMNTQHETIVELAELTLITNCALLCYEADYNFCHRSMVANAVAGITNASVEHIQSVARAT